MARKRGFKDPTTARVYLDRNYSNRAPGSRVQCLCVHTTESESVPNSVVDIKGVWNWFNNPASQASSHDIIDGDGACWRVVRKRYKAWTVGAANSFTINYELVARASWSPAQWKSNFAAVRKLAQIIAYDSKKYNVPIRRGKVGSRNGQCVCLVPGVITHRDVTNAGFGTHTDPGRWFPMRALLRMAKWYAKNGWYEGRAQS